LKENQPTQSQPSQKQKEKNVSEEKPQILNNEWILSVRDVLFICKTKKSEIDFYFLIVNCFFEIAIGCGILGAGGGGSTTVSLFLIFRKHLFTKYLLLLFSIFVF